MMRPPPWADRVGAVYGPVSTNAVKDIPVRSPDPHTFYRRGYPVLRGTGKRLVAEGTQPHTFELVGTKAMPSGAIVSSYNVAGPLKSG